MQRWFNIDAFAAFNPAPQAFGNAGVGIMRGPGYVNFDFTLAKNFQVNERIRVPIPHRVLQCFQSRQFRTAEYSARQQRIRSNSLGE